jgi:hypothetical protein
VKISEFSPRCAHQMVAIVKESAIIIMWQESYLVQRAYGGDLVNI